MTLANKCLAAEVFILFCFWHWLYIGMGADGIMTAAGFWVSSAFMWWVNHTIVNGFKP